MREKHFQDQGQDMCSVHHCDEDRNTQTMSEADRGNEFELFARLSCDRMITLAVSSKLEMTNTDRKQLER